MRTIVWDVDDVLNDLMRCWFERAWLPAHRESGLRYAAMTENPPHRLLGVPLSEYLESLDAFRCSAPAREMEPNAEVLAWLERYGSGFRHMALTARPLTVVPDLSHWLFRHFGAFIRTFAYVPSRGTPGLPEYDRSKAEFLEWLGKADILIDDSAENVAAAARLGIRAILYPRPWNTQQTPAGRLLQSLTSVTPGSGSDEAF